MYCDISIMLNAFVFIILKACLNLTEEWWKPCNKPYNNISHSCTQM